MKEKTKEKIVDKFLSVQSVAETLACTDKYVGILIRDGNLKAIKLGDRALSVSEKSLQDFIAARTVNPEDFYAPEEPPVPEPPPVPKKIARSNWMNR